MCKKFERELWCRRWEFRSCQSSGQSWMYPRWMAGGHRWAWWLHLLSSFFLHEVAFVPHSDAASDNKGGPVERTHGRWSSCILQQAEGGVFGPSWPEMWCCWSRRDPQKCAITGTRCCSEGCFFSWSPQQSRWSSSHWGGLLVLTPLDQLAHLAPAVGSIIVGHEGHHYVDVRTPYRFHRVNKAHVKYIHVSWDHLMGLLYKCNVLPYQGRCLAIF